MAKRQTRHCVSVSHALWPAMVLRAHDLGTNPTAYVESLIEADLKYKTYQPRTRRMPRGPDFTPRIERVSGEDEHDPVYRHKCPHCKAEPGEYCRGPKRLTRFHRPHRERRDALTLTIPDGEEYAVACPKCHAPAEEPCRTAKGRRLALCHTARLITTISRGTFAATGTEPVEEDDLDPEDVCREDSCRWSHMHRSHPQDFRKAS